MWSISPAAPPAWRPGLPRPRHMYTNHPLLHPGLCSEVTSSERRRHLLGPPSCLCPPPHQIPSVPPAQMVSTDHKQPCAVLPIPAAQAARGPEHQPPYSTHCNTPSPENFLLGFTLQHPLLLLLKERVSITGYDLDRTLPLSHVAWHGNSHHQAT